MIGFRLYLLAGLVAHKLLWEILKRRLPPAAARAEPVVARVAFLKGVKLVILLGVVAQTMLPDLLPITQRPGGVRVVGGVIYTTGLALAMLARLQLGTNWSDIETPHLQRAHTVVARGVYAYIRHPIYCGDLLLLLGLELALNSWLVLGVAAMAPFVVRQALGEERRLRQALPGYAAYCARTKRFVPHVV